VDRRHQRFEPSNQVLRHFTIRELLLDQRSYVAVNVRDSPGWPQHDVPLAFKASDVVGVVDEWAIQEH